MVRSQNLEKEVERPGCRLLTILKILAKKFNFPPDSCFSSFLQVEEEKTSHFVQLDDGTFAEMVEGHEMVAPGNFFLLQEL